MACPGVLGAAESASLAWALAAVTDREVVVPANPGVMGAWGIGLVAREALGVEGLDGAAAIPLAAALAARVVDRAELRCKDPRCATLCRIERTTVEVGARRTSVVSGGACPRFEVAAATRPKLPIEAPSAFDERQALLEPWLVPRPGAPRVGLPLTGSAIGYLPWLVTLLEQLGAGVEVIRQDARSLSRGEQLSLSYDACAPLKIAHAVADAGPELLLVPRVSTSPTGAGAAAPPARSRWRSPTSSTRRCARAGGRGASSGPSCASARSAATGCGRRAWCAWPPTWG